MQHGRTLRKPPSAAAYLRHVAHRYFLLNKPFNMLSQFVSPYPQAVLGDLDFEFPEGTHALGRLDLHTEGLLLLTTNSKVTRLLFQGAVPHPRTYYVQVKGIVSDQTAERLRTGIDFTIHGGRPYTSAPCEVSPVTELPFSFASPYNYNSYIQYSWLRLTLTEGKYHQVRKMVRTAGHPCVRLVRTSIEDLRLDGLQPGQVREVGEAMFFKSLNIAYPS